MRIRRMIVRAVNKLRGVDAEKMHKLRLEAGVFAASVALYMNVPLQNVYDWEDERAAIMKSQYEKAMYYLRMCKQARDTLRAEQDRKEFMESPAWRD